MPFLKSIGGFLAICGLVLILSWNRLMGPSEELTYDPSQPETLIQPGPMGPRLAPPGLARADGGVALVTDALMVFRPTTDESAPAGTFRLTLNARCRFARPEAGDLVANIRVSEGGTPLGVQIVSPRSLATWSEQWIEAQKAQTEPVPMGQDAAGDTARIIDVIVTETEKPVYLILQSTRPGIIWNIQKARDAKISNIALIGNGDFGVNSFTTPIPTVAVDASQPDSCAVTPAQKPSDNWQFDQLRASNGGQSPADFERDYERYAEWFQAQFGLSPEDGLIGFDGMGHVLIGPLPDENSKLRATKFDMSSLRISTEGEVITGDAEARQTEIAELMEATIRQATGGDMARLRPEPVQRSE